MCSQFELVCLSEAITESFPELAFAKNFEISQRFLPATAGPVIVAQDHQLKLVKMKFSMVPSWSKEPKVKFATHNARIESVEEKPTWKSVFLNQHCVVMMTGFFESVYTGPLAGHVIQFKQAQGKTLFAAGVFDFWNNDPDSSKHFFSFSILTEEPTPFILENGHDRSPIFLDEKYVKDWCSLKSNSYAETKRKLADWSLKPDLKVEVERPLKAGWEKRI
jgi:putative SOS response-associated peptidase YedK